MSLSPAWGVRGIDGTWYLPLGTGSITRPVTGDTGQATALRFSNNGVNSILRIDVGNVFFWGYPHTIVIVAKIISGSSGDLACNLGDAGPSGSYLSQLKQGEWRVAYITGTTRSDTWSTFIDIVDGTSNYVVDFAYVAVYPQISLRQIGFEAFGKNIGTVSVGRSEVESLCGKSANQTVNFSDFWGANREKQYNYISQGLFNWVCPIGCTSISVAAIGGGGGGAGMYFGGTNYHGGGGGAGGQLDYVNNFSVTAGSTYAGRVGIGGAGGNNGSLDNGFATGGGQGGLSYLNNTNGATIVQAFGGNPGLTGSNGTPGAGGSPGSLFGKAVGGGGGSGNVSTRGGGGGGGGGAAGYQGNGGWGGNGVNSTVSATRTTAAGIGDDSYTGGVGGNGGLGNNLDASTGGGGGGGTEVYGSTGLVTYNDQWTNSGAFVGVNPGFGGNGDRGWNDGGNNGGWIGGDGGGYGGGGGGGGGRGIGGVRVGGNGRSGMVRIIWAGDTRTYPSTNTTDYGPVY